MLFESMYMNIESIFIFYVSTIFAVIFRNGLNYMQNTILDMVLHCWCYSLNFMRAI